MKDTISYFKEHFPVKQSSIMAAPAYARLHIPGFSKSFLETLARAVKKENQIKHTAIRFNQVNIAALPIIRGYISESIERCVDFSMAGIFMWSEYFHYEFAEYNNTLIIKGIDPHTGRHFIQLPLNGNCIHDVNYIQTIVNKMNENGHHIDDILQFREVSKGELASNPDAAAGFTPYPMGREYIYPIEQFEYFKGKKMEKKRNHLNYFNKNFSGAIIEEISDSNLKEIIDFTLALHEGEELDELASYEIDQTVNLLKRYEKFNFTGLAIRNEGKIIGFTLGERVGDTFFVHIEKGDVSVHGVYQALSSSLARKVISRYPFVRFLNREEDMGDESLAHSKESYHPSSYIYKSYVEAKS